MSTSDFRRPPAPARAGRSLATAAYAALRDGGDVLVVSMTVADGQAESAAIAAAMAGSASDTSPTRSRIRRSATGPA